MKSFLYMHRTRVTIAADSKTLETDCITNINTRTHEGIAGQKKYIFQIVRNSAFEFTY